MQTQTVKKESKSSIDVNFFVRGDAEITIRDNPTVLSVELPSTYGNNEISLFFDNKDSLSSFIESLLSTYRDFVNSRQE